MKGDDIIEVKIIGVNCSNGIKLKKMLNRATEEIEEEIKITEISEKDKKYGIKNFPALIINNEIVSEGRVLSSREIKKLLLSY
ncbi:MAG: thioredoxin family protein [Bacilli bacterium]|nr:thioredoxin family protein [Bacilli bacterium]